MLKRTWQIDRDKVKHTDLLGELYPDGKRLQKIDYGHYKDMWTGIELISDTRPYNEKGKRGFRYLFSNWRIRFPTTGVEAKIKNRKEGTIALWEIREGVKHVLGNYFANSRAPDGRIRSFIADPNPLLRHYKGGTYGNASRNPTTSPVFLACI